MTLFRLYSRILCTNFITYTLVRDFLSNIFVYLFIVFHPASRNGALHVFDDVTGVVIT